MLAPLVESQVNELFGALRRYSFSWLNLIGQDGWTLYTPTRTGWTDVGSPTVTARYRHVGKKCEFQISVVPGTTCATVAGTSYVTLPMTASGIAGSATMADTTALTAVGTCVIDIANSRCYVPAQVATGDTLTIAGWFEVSQ